MVDNTIALQARAPRMLSYGELVANRDQEMSRRNALAIQQQQMQQNALAQQKARATESAMAGAASLANAGEFDAAEKQYGLGAGNLDVHKAIAGLQDEHRATIRARYAAAVPVAIQALREPDLGKRAALVQAAAPMLVQNGWKPEELAQFKPSDEALNSVINNARTAEEALKLYDKQNEAYTLGEGDVRFAGGKEIARGNPKREPEGQVAVYNVNGKDTLVRVVNGVAYPVSLGSGTPGSPTGGAPSGGALSVDALRGPIVAQESSGNYGAVSPKGALGAYQLMPPTAKSLAGRLGLPWKPELMTANTPEAKQYQDALGGAAIQEAIDASGGDLATAVKYYHGGSNRAVWGPKTEQYARDIAGRMGGGGETATPAVIGPKGGGIKVPVVDARRFQDIQATRQKILAAKRLIEARKQSVGAKFGLMPEWMAQRVDPEGVTARAALADIGSQVIHDRSGAAVTISETPRLKPFIASAGDEPNAIGNKLDSMLMNLQEEENALRDMYTDENGYSPLDGKGGRNAPAASARAAPAGKRRSLDSFGGL